MRVQEVASQRPSGCDMWKGNRGLISGPGQESRSRLLRKVWVCFFLKGSEDEVIRCCHPGPVKCSYKTLRLSETSRTMFSSNLSIDVLLCVVKLLPKAGSFFFFKISMQV